MQKLKFLVALNFLFVSCVSANNRKRVVTSPFDMPDRLASVRDRLLLHPDFHLLHVSPVASSNPGVIGSPVLSQSPTMVLFGLFPDFRAKTPF